MTKPTVQSTEENHKHCYRVTAK